MINEVVEIISASLIGILAFIAVIKISIDVCKAIYRHDLMDNKYKVPFKKHFNKVKVPLIKMNIAGELKYFIVDSGATQSILAKDYFSTMNKNSYSDLNYAQSAVGLNGTIQELPFIETTLSFKKDVFEDIPFMIADLKDIQDNIKKASNITIAGVLGTTFFVKYKWAIDFDERCIWINVKNDVKNGNI